MKPKSFKSKGLLGDGSQGEQQMLAEHLYFSERQFEQRDGLVVVTLDYHWADRPLDTSDLTSGGIIGLGDTLALTIGDSPKIVMARVSAIQPGGDQLQVELTEHRPNQPELGQAPSAAWEKFLKELKKKCGSGHHNKKQKTLLHVVIVAKALQVRPERIKLTVLPARGLAVAGEDVAEQIRGAIFEAEKEGESVSLDQIEDFFSERPEVVEAKYVPQAAQMDATTYMMNGVPVRREYLAEPIETISIPKERLENAVKFSTGGDLLSLSDLKVNWTVTAYSHGDNLTTHKSMPIGKISVSQNDLEYNLELYVSLEARAWRNNNHAPHLVVISGSKSRLEEAGEPAEEEPAEEELLEKDYDRTLAISPGKYEFVLPESNDGARPLKITIPLLGRERARFEEDQSYLISVGNTHSAAYRVKSVTIDAVEEKATVKFDYEGGDRIITAQRGELIMNRVSIASQPIDEALTLTIEKEEDIPDLNGAVDPEQTNLEVIADEIRELLQEDPDKYVRLEEVVDWIAENHQLSPDLMVTGADYMAQRAAYETSSSISGIAQMDVFESKNRKYVLIDLMSEIENVQSLVNISILVNDKPVSEVKESYFVEELDEIRRKAELRGRQAQLAVVPSGGQDVFLSIYNGEKGYAVCNNERIDRVLRKKKDGKCIYRMVVKKSAKANQIAYGKHQTCVVFIDQQQPC